MNDKQYFTKDHEDAILEYATILDHRRKNELYEKYIQPAFNEMDEDEKDTKLEEIALKYQDLITNHYKV